VPNEIKRYSLGTKNKTLKPNPDGSLTIYAQVDPPPPARRDNWLPAPKGADFCLFIGAYWPKTPIIDGSWTLPAVARVGEGVASVTVMGCRVRLRSRRGMRRTCQHDRNPSDS
jgi:Protein of unknown function (DUF1214)